MDLEFTAEDELFREKVRDWLTANVPAEPRPHEGPEMRAFDCAWQRKQYDAGWAGIAWPTRYGGQGLSLIQQLIWHEEYARAKAPYAGCFFVALNHGGPTLIARGDEYQKTEFLPKILKGETPWCQGFSEPGSGSDLASLRTRAEIDGDHLVVNGSKIWTSAAQHAVYQELLVRTDPEAPRHRGITWVIGDMRLPGVEIRPIRAMDGAPHFAQVFYDNVRIPLRNVVGEINDGWSVAMATLGFERGTASIADQIELSRVVEELIVLAGELPAPDGRRRAIEDDAIAADLAAMRAEVATLRSMSYLSISKALREPVPGPDGVIIAVYQTELRQRVFRGAMDLLGAAGLELNQGNNHWLTRYLNSFSKTISGGTSEIRRNIIGERVLGLPR
ncbi:MAG: acyl-CoA dehydrogenase family protein [Caulobacteraceae bacterium]|nr:acyl-CoA dehydrogenase family protein [Caulobacteraceae bacterium]